MTRSPKASKRSAHATLATLPTIDDEGNYLAVIEVSAGSRNKYKFDPGLQAMQLHAVLPLGTSFPYCFGFIPSTKGEDGDPIDVIVFMDEAALPATVVPCRVVGIIEAEQTDGSSTLRNDRILAVAEKTHRYRECTGLTDLSNEVLDEIERFFAFYNKQRGTTFRPLKRRGKGHAKAAIETAHRRFLN